MAGRFASRLVVTQAGSKLFSVTAIAAGKEGEAEVSSRRGRQEEVLGVLASY